MLLIEVTAADVLALNSLTAVLSDALHELASSGRPDAANRLAGRAYIALRHEYPAQAQQINALMHQLTFIAAPTEEPNMAVADTQLDVRNEIPARRHQRIFETYDRLAPGEGFVLINDHDPKPLYYQLAAEHPDELSWDYLEQGPETWRVRIARSGTDTVASSGVR